MLIIGPPGSGKSDLLLRLLDRGFALVADDRVDIDGLAASAPPSLSGLLEVRGLGIMRLPCLPSCTLALVAALGGPVQRLPSPERHPGLDVPLVRVDSACASAGQRVELALDVALGRLQHAVGAFRA